MEFSCHTVQSSPAAVELVHLAPSCSRSVLSSKEALLEVVFCGVVRNVKIRILPSLHDDVSVHQCYLVHAVVTKVAA